MKQKILMEKYPVFELEIGFNETNFKSVDEVLGFLKSKIYEHPVANSAMESWAKGIANI